MAIRVLVYWDPRNIGIFFQDHFHFRVKVTLITLILEFYLKNHYNRDSMVNLKFAIYQHPLKFLDATVLLIKE